MKHVDFNSIYYKRKQIKYCYNCKKSIIGNGFWEVFRPDGKTHPICFECDQKYFSSEEKELKELYY